jgi:hypothetical protein
MKYARLALIIITLLGITNACEKYDIRSSNIMTVSVNNSYHQGEMSIHAIKSTSVPITEYETLEIIGSGKNAELNSSEYFSIILYASSLIERTYTIPEYSLNYNYNLSEGFATGYYAKGPLNHVEDWYCSQFKLGAGGSVTITKITNKIVSGTYNMKLTDGTDSNKSLKLSGSFQTELSKLEN